MKQPSDQKLISKCYITCIFTIEEENAFTIKNGTVHTILLMMILWKKENLCKYTTNYNTYIINSYNMNLVWIIYYSNIFLSLLHSFGMVFSLKDLAMKLSPTNSVDGLHTLKTNSFTLHHFQTLSGLIFVINSSPDVQGLLWLHIVTQFLLKLLIFS